MQQLHEAAAARTSPRPGAGRAGGERKGCPSPHRPQKPEHPQHVQQLPVTAAVDQPGLGGAPPAVLRRLGRHLVSRQQRPVRVGPRQDVLARQNQPPPQRIFDGGVQAAEPVVRAGRASVAWLST